MTKWVTRERPKIGRIACPWLIRRFVEPEAEFLYVPPERVFVVAEERARWGCPPTSRKTMPCLSKGWSYTTRCTLGAVARIPPTGAP